MIVAIIFQGNNRKDFETVLCIMKEETGKEYSVWPSLPPRIIINDELSQDTIDQLKTVE